MKKLLSILLALTLVFSLTLPALAVEPEPVPGYEGEEVQSDFDRGWDAGYDAGYDAGRDKGKADFEAGAPMAEPELSDDLWDGETYREGYDKGYAVGYSNGYVSGYAEAYGEGYELGYEETYDAAYDQGFADGTARTPQDPEDMAPAMSDLEDYSYEAGVNDGRRDGVLNGYWDGYLDASDRPYEDDLDVYARGGVPGGVNVMFNGEMVRFPDQRPEMKNDRTMVPVRAVMESMGAQVDYEASSKTVIITLNGASTVFTVGSSAYSVTKDGQVTKGTMDCACYNSNGRVMVPVRFLAEASGYTVLWDGHHRTAIVADAEGLAAEIDKSFTCINGILAARLTESQGKKQESTTAFTVKNTLYDEEGKAFTFPLSGKVTSCTDGTAWRVDISLSIKDALQSMIEYDSGLLSDATISLRTAMRADLTNLTAALILDKEGNLYFQAPVLLELLGSQPMEDDQWLSLGNLGQFGVDMSDLAGGTMTVGSLVTAMLLSDGDSAYYLSDTLEVAVPMLEAIYGDSNARQSGSGYTWDIDLFSILAAAGLAEMTAEDMAGSAFTASLTADVKGNYSLTGDWRFGGEDMALTGSLNTSGTATSGRLTLKLALTEVFELELTGESTVRFVQTLPALALPEGAEVLDSGMGI